MVRFVKGRISTGPHPRRAQRTPRRQKGFSVDGAWHSAALGNPGRWWQSLHIVTALTAQELLERLTATAKQAPAHALAALAVDALLDRPVAAGLTVERLLELFRTLALGFDEKRLAAALEAEWERTAGNAKGLAGSVAQHLPPHVLGGLREAVGQPVVLDATLLMRVVDQPAVRALLQDVLGVVVADAVRRVGQPLQQNALVSGMFSRAKGMMAGSVAGGILAAVGEGLSAEAERRLKDGADDMVSMALARMVASVCDVRQVQTYGALRARMVQSALEAPVGDWVRQVMAAHPAKAVMVVALSVRQSVLAPEFEGWLRAHLPLWLPPPDTTARAWLEDAGLLKPVREAAVDWVAADLLLVLHSPAFALWLGEVFGAATPPSAAPARTARARREAPAAKKPRKPRA
jgi:hypothetical protein